jgi:competence protein ComEC
MKKLLLFLLFLFPLTAFADLEVHFLDVGHGDCTIITCDGEAMIIDGGVPGCSQQVFNYIISLGIADFKYAVATHPDADHIGGLPAAFHAANVKTLLSPIEKHGESRFATLLKTAQEKDVPLVVPQAGKVLSLGEANITVLSPVIQFADTNDLSLVLRLDYGKTSFIFTGDASTAVERDLIARKSDLDADVLKVSHHGSSTGTSSEFVSAVSPQYAVISCANMPSIEVLYALAESSTLITAQKGSIIIHSDGISLTARCEKSSSPQTDQFVGNANSKVFHLSICDSVSNMSDKNKRYFDTIEQAESKGYRPCKNCSPKRN